MTKKEALKINVKKYNSHDKCPEYSEKSEFPNKYSFIFYCIDDNNCQSDNNSTSPYFYFTDKDNKVIPYIKEYCNDDLECKPKAKCTSNSDCLSNNCTNSACYQGRSLFTECSNIEDTDSFYYGHHKMKCGRPNGEDCTDSDQCAGKCIWNRCYSQESFVPTAPIHLELLFLPVLLLIFLCFGCTICVMCFRRYKKRNVKQ